MVPLALDPVQTVHHGEWLTGAGHELGVHLTGQTSEMIKDVRSNNAVAGFVSGEELLCP